MPERCVSSAVELVASNPGLELLVGHTVYDSDGGIVWDKPATLERVSTVVADFGRDGDPEVVLAAGPGLYMLDSLGLSVRKFDARAYIAIVIQHLQPHALHLCIEFFGRCAHDLRALQIDGH